MNGSMTNQNQGSIDISHGPALPMSSIGPDCHIELLYPPGNHCVLVVRRDETVSGWALNVLPARSTTVTCGGNAMTATPDYSGPIISGRHWGTLDITSVYHANTAVHTSYDYNGDNYYEDFANGAYNATTPATPSGEVILVCTREPRIQLRVTADGKFILELSPEGLAELANG